jgi:protein-disulfide isomerase
VDTSRRNLIIGAGAVIAVGIVGYAVWSSRSGSPLQGPSPASDTAGLLAPGALPDMVMGAENAPVTIVEYASLTCPHCREFAHKTFPELKKRYIDTGKVRFIFREYALNEVDQLAIVTARCAPKERYFALVDTLFEKQETWAVNNPVPPLLAIAKQAGFSEESFKACAANQQIIQAVSAQREAGSRFGVNSTPTFFINGQKHSGGMGIAEFEKLLQPYLKG